MTKDLHPPHVVNIPGRRSIFEMISKIPGPYLHGSGTFSFINGFLRAALAFTDYTDLMVCSADNLRYLAANPVSSRISCEFEIDSIKEKTHEIDDENVSYHSITLDTKLYSDIVGKNKPILITKLILRAYDLN